MIIIVVVTLQNNKTNVGYNDIHYSETYLLVRVTEEIRHHGLLVVIGDTDLCHRSRVDPPDCNISNFQWIQVIQILIVYGLDLQCVL